MTAELGRKFVLVVEDDTLLRMVAVDMLQDAGFDVIEADTADAGARIMAEAHTLDGLVTDIETPGELDGVGLARITHERYPNAAILVVSGRVKPDTSTLPPGSRFIGKPYSNVLVLNALQDLLTD